MGLNYLSGPNHLLHVPPHQPDWRRERTETFRSTWVSHSLPELEWTFAEWGTHQSCDLFCYSLSEWVEILQTKILTKKQSLKTLAFNHKVAYREPYLFFPPCLPAPATASRFYTLCPTLSFRSCREHSLDISDLGHPVSFWLIRTFQITQ